MAGMRGRRRRRRRVQPTPTIDITMIYQHGYWRRLRRGLTDFAAAWRYSDFSLVMLIVAWRFSIYVDALRP